jgi:predicted metal-dependent peptidase
MRPADKKELAFLFIAKVGSRYRLTCMKEEFVGKAIDVPRKELISKVLANPQAFLNLEVKKKEKAPGVEEVMFSDGSRKNMGGQQGGKQADEDDEYVISVPGEDIHDYPEVIIDETYSEVVKRGGKVEDKSHLEGGAAAVAIGFGGGIFKVIDWQGKTRLMSANKARELAVGYGLTNVRKVYNNDFVAAVEPLDGRYSQISKQEVGDWIKKNVEKGTIEKEGYSKGYFVGSPDRRVRYSNDRSLSGSMRTKVKNYADDEGRVNEALARIMSSERAGSDGREFTAEESIYSTVGESLRRSLGVLQAYLPFGYCALQGMPREEIDVSGYESDEAKVYKETMGVTINKFVYNPFFVCTLTLPELNYVVAHEALHVIMRHHVRKGKREHERWNIACDAYINMWIVKHLIEDNTKGAAIFKRPANCVFFQSVNIDKDIPEDLYREMKIKKTTVNYNPFKSGSAAQVVQQAGISGSELEKYDMTYEVVEVTLRGKTIIVRAENDMKTDAQSEELSEEGKRQVTRELLQEAAERKKRLPEKRQAGKAADNEIEREVEFELAPKVYWANLLKQFLNEATGKRSSVFVPDRRFITRGKHFPGYVKAEPNTIGRVLVAIDTSGSMSAGEIGIIYKQLIDITSYYKLSAEVEFWDTSVYARQIATRGGRMDMLKKIKPKGGGSTDINCVFDDLEQQRKSGGRGLYKDPEVIIIGTDGGYGVIKDEYKDRYGKKIIWLITPTCYSRFQEDVGKIATMDVSELQD